MRHALMTTTAALGFASAPAPLVPTPPTPVTDAAPKADRKPRASSADVKITGVGSITMPEAPSRKGGIESKYNFSALEVGQAFGVIGKDKRGMAGAVSAANKKNRADATDGSGGTVQIKEFFAFDVTDEYRKANKDSFAKGAPFEGATVLVFRRK